MTYDSPDLFKTIASMGGVEKVLKQVGSGEIDAITADALGILACHSAGEEQMGRSLAEAVDSYARAFDLTQEQAMARIAENLPVRPPV